MAGVYGAIDGRQDFFHVLSAAQSTLSSLGANASADPTLASVRRQLDTIAQWTANGRTPTEDERTSIDMGLLAARELENSGDPRITQWAEQLQWLNNYFEDWPSDDEAASATDDDYFESDD